MTLDLAGQRFGHLIATNQLKRCGSVTKRLCRCDCGQEVWRGTGELTSGHGRSCGCSARNRLDPGVSARNSVKNAYVQRARKLGLKWSLSAEEFDRLIQTDCHYCGSGPSNVLKNSYGNGDVVYSGLDRVNNNEGYVSGNVVACCFVCNRAKLNLSLDDFLAWARKIAERHA